MPIPFHCRHCQALGQAQDKYAGKVVACPRCKKQVQLSQPAAVVPPPPPPAPPKAKTLPTVQATPKIPRRIWPPLMFLWGLLVLFLPMFLGAYSSEFGFRIMPWVFGIALFLFVLGPTIVAIWQVKTPRRGPVPPRHVISMIEWSVLLVAGFVFWESRHQDTSGFPWTNRISLAVALWAVMAKIARRTYGLKTWYALVPLMLLVIFTWSRFDYQEHHWTNEEDPEDQQWEYTDLQYRNADHPFFRKMYRWGGKDGDYISMSMSGPMSDSGKLHGHWETSIWLRGDGRHRNTDEWYWYGEVVSEGEWHLRNK